MSVKDPFANTWQNSEMSVSGLKCTLHMPEAIKRQFDANGNELTASLPPYSPRPSFAVDEFLTAPTGWMHGSGKASSYFVPVMPESGMWFDFNANAHHTHDVAVVVSVQGINPLTGRKIDPVRLEQYRENCPVHNQPFKQDLFCDACQFKWNPQNYIASNVTPSGYFWIDGFRTEDGTVRQWYFTEEEAKGVAAQLIGDQRVFAIGIAFYLSKKPKPKPQVTYRGRGASYFCSSLGGYGSGMVLGSCASAPVTDYSVKIHNAVTSASLNSTAAESLDFERGDDNVTCDSLIVESANIERNAKKLEIGAGAKIHQTIYRDSENLDYWEPEPAGMIYINYCDVDTAQRIIKAGKRQEKKDGFLTGLNLK